MQHAPKQPGAPAVDLRVFMRCMYRPDEKLEDAVMVMVSRYYNNLCYNFADSDSIAAFYAADAVSGCSTELE